MIFCTKEYEYLGLNSENIERMTFQDGETYLRITKSVNDQDVYIIGGTSSDKSLMEIYDLACAAVMYGAKSLNIIIPYYGYSTMERALLPGEVVKAKTRARLLSSIPKATKGNVIYLFDIHSEGIVHYFENGTRAKVVDCQIADRVAHKYTNCILGSTDAGRAKTVEQLGEQLSLDVALVLKRRSGGEVVHTSINANVKGKTVVIYDDMIRSGSTLLAAATSYKKAGANFIIFIASHGVFSNRDILDNKLISKFYVTDSHPNSMIKHKKLKVVSIKHLIKQIVNNKSRGNHD